MNKISEDLVFQEKITLINVVQMLESVGDISSRLIQTHPDSTMPVVIHVKGNTCLVITI